MFCSVPIKAARAFCSPHSQPYDNKECFKSVDKNGKLQSRKGAVIKMDSNKKKSTIQIFVFLGLVATIGAAPVTLTLTKEAKVSFEAWNYSYACLFWQGTKNLGHEFLKIIKSWVPGVFLRLSQQFHHTILHFYQCSLRKLSKQNCYKPFKHLGTPKVHHE